MSVTQPQQTVYKRFTYKLKPTPSQERTLERHLALCRYLYNTALEQRITFYKQRGIAFTLNQQSADLTDLRKSIPEFAEPSRIILQDVLIRLDTHYQGFFRRVRRGEKPGFPRFKSATRYHSFTYRWFGNRAPNRLDGKHVILSKIGRLALHWSRPLEGTVKTVTIKHQPDGWYISFLCEDVPITPLPSTGVDTGIDLGIAAFVTTASGDQITNPRFSHAAHKALRRADRRMARRKKGSNRRKKALKLLTKVYQRVSRQRADFHHKTALALVRQYDTIYHEDLQITNLMRNSHFARELIDVGWGAFLLILSYKAACAGRRVVAVDPAYTSQACSGCGVMVKKSLQERWHSCPECGAELDRDHNAALNILQQGREASAGGQPAQAQTKGGGLCVA